MNERVVVTGIGVLSPLGIGVDPFLDALTAGRSGIAHTDDFGYTALPGNVAGEVRDYDEKQARKTWLKQQRRNVKVMCREIQMGVASASIALDHSGIDLEAIDHTRLGIDFGANLMLSPPEVLAGPAAKCTDQGDANFHFERWGHDGLEEMEPLWLLKYLPNMPACHIGISYDCEGPSNSITQDEASGGLCIGEAARIIERGAADVMITGTTGTRLHTVKSLHARLWDELADGDGRPPETWCRPFDRERIGQVAAEGAGTLVLEREAHATERGATIYGTVLGVGAACAADRDGRPLYRTALVNAMQAALRDAGLDPADVGHVNAHGLATRTVDVEEAAAINDVFGERGQDVPVTALKSCLGNSGSGCGILELAGSLLAARQGFVPRTLNYEHPDPECPVNVVHGDVLKIDNKTFLKVNVTRIGQAAAVVVEAS